MIEEVLMENEKKELLKVFRKLDPENRANVLTYAQVAYTTQEHTKRHYGIFGPDAPLFSGSRPGPSDPAYALPGPGPVMEAQA